MAAKTWWDQRAEYNRLLAEGRVPYQQERVRVDPPVTAVEAWEREMRTLTRNLWEREYSTSFTTYSVDSAPGASTTGSTTWQRIRSDDVVDSIRYVPEMAATLNPPDEWSLAPEIFRICALGRVNQHATEVEYIHTHGRCTIDNMRRLLARYWNTQERVDWLFTQNRQTDIMAPSMENTTWQTKFYIPVRMPMSRWGEGTQDNNCFMWHKERWWMRPLRHPSYSWEPINPEQP